MPLMQPAQQTPHPALVSALLPVRPRMLHLQAVLPAIQPVLVSTPAAALIFMLPVPHAQLIQTIAKTHIAIVREVSAVTVLIPAALLTVVITIAAAGFAVLRKLVVLIIAIARVACVILPRLIALTNAPPTNVLMVSVLILLKATVKRIAAVWPSAKEHSLIFWMTTIAALLTLMTPQA